MHFLKKGWSVVGITKKDKYSNYLAENGIIMEAVDFSRRGLSLCKDITAFLKLLKIYWRYNPSLIHHFHSKPIILGGFAAMISRNKNVVNTITGLGHAFIKGGFIERLVATGYRLSLLGSAVTIFQNSDDLDLFVDKGWAEKSKTRLIVSSGVDIERFKPDDNRTRKRPRVLMVSRLLWQKGVREFVEAARILKERYPTVRFYLGGEWDKEHPDAVDADWMNRVVFEGTIEFLGYIKNMPDLLRETTVFVLPSSYREGVPRVLIEAAAVGVPVISTNLPGCKEVVRHGKNGFLVPSKDSHALAEKIATLLNNSALREKMGHAGRLRAEREFDIRIVNERTLNIYEELGIDVR
jgi:glycosyltransferase involved in cell wall biosynthesis